MIKRRVRSNRIIGSERDREKRLYVREDDVVRGLMMENEPLCIINNHTAGSFITFFFFFPFLWLYKYPCPADFSFLLSSFFSLSSCPFFFFFFFSFLLSSLYFLHKNAYKGCKGERVYILYILGMIFRFECCLVCWYEYFFKAPLYNIYTVCGPMYKK